MARSDENDLRGPDAVSRTENPRMGSKTSLVVLALFLGLLLLIVVLWWGLRERKPVENNPDTVSQLLLRA